MIKAVFFDAGNTLIRSYGVGKEELLRHICRSFSPRHAALPLDWQKGAEAMELHFQLSRMGGNKGSYAANLRTGLKAAGLPGEDAEKLSRVLASRRLPKRLRPEPGALLLLQQLKKSGFRLAVVSNWSGTLERGLAKLGMARWFDVIADSGKVGVRKPDPRIFRYACRKMGVRPEEAVHVGDIYVADVLGAKAAGIRGVLYDPLGVMTGRVSCPVIRRLPELAGWLEKGRENG
jgi:HAD superfamily hydrolase (TIGR01509 family)